MKRERYIQCPSCEELMHKEDMEDTHYNGKPAKRCGCGVLLMEVK